MWCGSVGSFYRLDLGVKVADAIGRPLTVLTRQVELARSILAGRAADVRSAPHERIPTELAPGDIGLCLYSIGFANLARAPTRFAEYLAAGMVCAVSPGVGDLEKLVSEHQVGTVIESETEAAIQVAATRLRRLSDDPGAPARCRALAARLFSLDAGVQQYLSCYRELVDADVETLGDTTASARRSPTLP